MTVRFYLVPIEEVADGVLVYRGPKYFAWEKDPDPPALLPSVEWRMRDYGLEPTGLVAANVDSAQHASLNAQTDVTAVPQNLDLELGGNLAATQDALELFNLPSDMLTVTHTYRQVLRGVNDMMMFAQRFNARRGRTGRLFPLGITLATTLGDLSAGVRDDLSTVAAEMKYDHSGLTLSSTLRAVLKKIAAQQTEFMMLGVVV